MTRKPAFAGRFYPAGEKKIKRKIKSLFRHDLGPGEIPSKPSRKRRAILGVMVPHAGWTYSGAVSAHAYETLLKDGKPETFILLGPNHTGMGFPVSVYPEGKWATPLGDIEIDDQLASLLTNEDTAIKEGKFAHEGEHSLEVQLPFLQFIYPEGNFKIVPIACKNQKKEIMKKLAGKVIDAVEKTGRDTVILASTDLSHYVPHKKAKSLDNEALRAIEELEVEKLYKMVSNGFSMCGYGPVSVLIHCAKHWGAIGATLQYATSGDVVGDKSQVVGYGAVAFTEVKPEEKEEKAKIKEKAAPI